MFAGVLVARPDVRGKARRKKKKKRNTKTKRKKTQKKNKTKERWGKKKTSEEEETRYKINLLPRNGVFAIMRFHVGARTRVPNC